MNIHPIYDRNWFSNLVELLVLDLKLLCETYRLLLFSKSKTVMFNISFEYKICTLNILHLDLYFV